MAWLSLKGHSGLFNVESWAHTRGQYLGDHLGPALASTTLTIILSCALVVLFWAVFYFRRPGRFRPGSSVWADTLASVPNGKCNWVGVHRRDELIVEGVLFSFTAGPDDNPREIAMKSPIYLTPVGGTRGRVDIDRVIIPGDEIMTITARHVPKHDVPSEPSLAPAPSPSSS